ncbi:hypothetical protein M438DRAFT_170936 [Aureobasidium pullulans EXF-150]|uniref:Uncharacterized protein n=1 Tax=Aureobasidium pullulans EXF-150 TaxID=1043002 RepID=A0A074X998_AURPU|nr:uncharacterized protein M438DRAFT_170936 [Aureobasidium pullulans EXF-150]KEQ78612.1 hypothetical protein M438DRAFT_170936 [Aureobasidium pullulans EXF-150]
MALELLGSVIPSHTCSAKCRRCMAGYGTFCCGRLGGCPMGLVCGSPHLGRAEREIGVRHSRTQKSFVGKTSLCFMLSCFLAFVQPPI